MDEGAHEAPERVGLGGGDGEGGGELGEAHGLAVFVEDVGDAEIDGSFERYGFEVTEDEVQGVGLSLEELSGGELIHVFEVLVNVKVGLEIFRVSLHLLFFIFRISFDNMGMKLTLPAPFQQFKNQSLLKFCVEQRQQASNWSLNITNC